MQVDLEFEYHHSVGIVVVEATFDITPPDPTARDSDWDFMGSQILQEINVFLDNERVYVDIPDSILYSELRNKLRDSEINDAFSEEEGGF